MQVLIPDGIFANSFGSPTRPHWEPGVALAFCMAFNNAAAAQKALPDTFIATARVPLALDVQDRVAKRNARNSAPKLSSSRGLDGQELDEIELFPFWRTIADLGAVIYVHGNPSTVR